MPFPTHSLMCYGHFKSRIGTKSEKNSSTIHEIWMWFPTSCFHSESAPAPLHSSNVIRCFMIQKLQLRNMFALPDFSQINYKLKWSPCKCGICGIGTVSVSMDKPIKQSGEPDLCTGDTTQQLYLHQNSYAEYMQIKNCLNSNYPCSLNTTHR